ncbi:LytTR family DNA-binding domain-containing protein [Tenacibaculum jejuense]|uniref:HTH LytTR-type domain-containing protein n=1 Tax=Tenacibaculum jejuense TaxID=584609 RepID=A0A238U9T5_9FLAO|nr:LytTR family DNA-binding domain-containing protein [Tenacibaculum jejuense]SNR15973.1 Protein of unknown function [Tenacibaculum jejuense]
MKSIFFKPFPVSSLTDQIQISLFIGLFVSFTLIVFQPFGTYEFKMNNKIIFLLGYGFISAISYATYYFLFMTYYRKWFYARWNIIKEIITVIPVIIITTIICVIYYNLFVTNYSIRIKDIGSFLILCFSVSFIPLSFFYYNKFLKSKLVIATSIENSKDFMITIDSNNKKEKSISINSKELVYIKSSGNYIEVSTRNNVSSFLIRNSLKYVETKLPKHQFLRVHRSYIVNIKMITSVTLKGSSYYIKILDSDSKIPISRAMVKTIRNII